MKHRRIWFVMLGIIAVGVLVTTCNSFILNKKSATARAPREMAMAETTAGAQFEAAGGGDTGEAETKADSANAVQAQTSGSGTSEARASDGVPMAEIAAAETTNSQVEETMSEVLSPLETTAAVTFIESEQTGPGAPPTRKSATLMEGDNGKASYRARLDELDLQIQKIRSSETEAATYSMKTAAENELKLWDSELNNIYNDLLNYLDEEQTKELVSAEREWMKERDAKAVEAAKNSAGGTLEGLEYTASLAESTRQRAYALADMYEQVAE